MGRIAPLLHQISEIDRQWHRMRALKNRGDSMYGFTKAQHMELMGMLQDERKALVDQVHAAMGD